MTLIEKRDFILNHIYELDEKIVNELYYEIHSTLKGRSSEQKDVIKRALKAEDDISEGWVFTKSEAMERIKIHK